MIYLNSRMFKIFFSKLIIFFFFQISYSYSNLIRDTEIENIIYGWSKPIFEVAGLSKNSIKIHIIADDQINAFVTGGKDMYLNTGLIKKAGSANALLGVIAHETGHIAAGHILKLKQKIRGIENKQLISNLMGIGLYILGTSKSNTLREKRGEYAKAVLSIGPDMVKRSFFSYSRGNEYVADSLAVKYLKKVNRNPRAVGIILKKLYGKELLVLEKQDPFLRTHPLTKDRMDYIDRITKGNEVVETKEDNALYLRIQAKLNGFLDAPGRVLLKNRGNTLSQRYARVIGYFRSPVFNKALKGINSLLKDYPNDPYFWELKGQILSENGYIDEAILCYEKSLNIITEAPLIYLALANLLIEKNQSLTSIKRAQLLLNKVNIEEPDNILAWHLKGITHNRLGEYILADLSAAEEFIRRRDRVSATFFSKKVIKNSSKNSPESLRAQDILKIVNTD